MDKYSEEFIVPYYDCNKFGDIKPIALLEYLVETSSLQSDSMKLGAKELILKDYAWILSRWKIKIYDYPKAREKIVIQTWASDFDKFYANREFKIYDDKNKLLLKASTLWVFMSRKRMRPIRIPKEMTDRFNYIEKKNFEEFYNFDSEFKAEDSSDFKVRKTDIDYNNHVNNAKYLNWILETIPLEIDENYDLDEIDIYYRKEIRYDHVVESKLSHKEKTDNGIVFLHKIFNKDSGELITEGRTYWKKRED